MDQVPPILSALANAVYPPFILALCIGLPSAVLYALQLGLIVRFRKSHFNSSFFKLFAVRAVANLAGLVGAFLYQRFGLLGLFLPLYLQLPRLCLATFYFLVVHSFHVENLATCMMLLNRLTVIVWPTNQRSRQLWHRSIPWAICLIFLLPLPFTWHIFTLDEFVRLQQDNSSTFTLDNQRSPESPDDVKIAAWSAGLFTLVCSLINVACVLAYRRHRKTVQQQPGAGNAGNNEAQERKMEAKLTLYALLTFAAQTFYGLYMILLQLVVNEARHWAISQQMAQSLFLAVFNQLPWVNDLCTIAVPAWLLLWASGEMRKQFASIFNKFLRPSSNVQPISNGPRSAWSE